MIRIEAIQGLEDSYYNRVVNNRTYVRKRLRSAIATMPIDEQVKQFLIENLEEVITGDPEFLQAQLTLIPLSQYASCSSQFKNSLKQAFNYKNFRNSEYRGKWFAKQINVKT